MDFLNAWGAKAIGSAIGVIISMVMIAPRNWRNALYRAVLGTIAGVVFSPAMQNLVWFLAGDSFEHHIAAACAAGFTAWFILEATARFLSKEDTLRRLLEEMVRLSGKSGDKKE